ncbi:hypothetical protein CI109_101196 [Kwoniella shandongensis]|uniref:Uncharacterized protein n=1 Tax=Kwoniella shandongensis TaxID=1734106 RepID=A0A5M6BTM3_9TREE|nr:uncharacterized protein CI109_005486 [Kwoniella shandongensis]KAA5526208.1 hypothetical protein CI109_005486 [Kwoniella shandongensis]
MQKTKGEGIDFRAEEDAARRMNVGKLVNLNPSITGANSRGKKTDLIGKTALREKVEAIAKDHGLAIDNDSSLYLLAAIETRLRLLLSSSISAQTHRTNSSHLRQPPIRPSSSKVKDETGSGSGKALWSHVITSDPNAVLDALNRANRDSEQEFRLSRMDRLAREAEVQKARERAAAMASGDMSSMDYPSSPLPSSLGGGGGEAGPSTPISKPSSLGGGGSTPMFGAIKETPKSGKKFGSGGPGSSGKKGSARDVSAEVQHKMANATAMRSVGMGKKYGWMMGNAPAISSPLAGGAGSSKKRKAEKEKEKEKHKDKEEGSTTPHTTTTADGGRPTKRVRPSITQPTRRLVSVINSPTPTPTGETEKEKEKEVEKRVTDDRVLTMVDVVFALEHGGLGEASGQGMGGPASEVLQRLWARPGGPWGKESWGEVKK